MRPTGFHEKQLIQVQNVICSTLRLQCPEKVGQIPVVLKMTDLYYLVFLGFVFERRSHEALKMAIYLTMTLRPWSPASTFWMLVLQMFSSYSYCLGSFETRSCWVAQAVTELTIFLPLSKYYDCRSVPRQYLPDSFCKLCKQVFFTLSVVKVIKQERGSVSSYLHSFLWSSVHSAIKQVSFPLSYL